VRVVDLTQPFGMHTPGWVSYPSPKISYFQRHHTHGIVSRQHITKKMPVRKGDILIYHTGWWRYYTGGPEADEVRYFCRHPGGGRELAEWIVEMQVMHHVPFRAGIVHVENLGGDIAQVLNRRCLIGCFPWRFVGGEASPCRVVAFVEE